MTRLGKSREELQQERDLCTEKIFHPDSGMSYVVKSRTNFCTVVWRNDDSLSVWVLRNENIQAFPSQSQLELFE